MFPNGFALTFSIAIASISFSGDRLENSCSHILDLNVRCLNTGDKTNSIIHSNAPFLENSGRPVSKH